MVMHYANQQVKTRHSVIRKKRKKCEYLDRKIAVFGQIHVLQTLEEYASAKSAKSKASHASNTCST
jgi:hypothetical protein